MRASSLWERSAAGIVTPNTRLRPSPDFSTICIDILRTFSSAIAPAARTCGVREEKTNTTGLGGGRGLCHAGRPAPSPPRFALDSGATWHSVVLLNTRAGAMRYKILSLDGGG